MGNVFAVPCEDGEVRLSGGSNERIGQVEMCVNGSLRYLCGRSWDINAASVVCRQLGFSPYGLLLCYYIFN